MVQYVFTPWRDRHELLLVREQLYGSSPSISSAAQAEAEADDGTKISTLLTPCTARGGGEEGTPPPQRALQHQAVARISMWVQRGNCPHMVESTALLMAAVLSDEAAAMQTRSSGSSTYAVRAAYSAAFSRFVTGLLDSHQDKLRKQSMYSIAKVIGLPATFVELRHQSTHEQLPSLAKLRSAASRALAWIWGYYWEHLSESDSAPNPQQDPCRAALLRYLREDDEARRAKIIKELDGSWETDRLLRTLAELQETLPGNQVYLKCLKLSRDLLAWEEKRKSEKETEVEVEVDAEEKAQDCAVIQENANQSAQEGSATGWSSYQGQWEPKPIGVV